MRKFTLGLLLILLLPGQAVAEPTGLVVSIGTDAADQLSRDWQSPGCIYQCLSTDVDEVTGLRDKIDAQGVNGKVTARSYDGVSLPYIDNSVNHIICSGTGGSCPKEEILRVLAPGGTAMVTGQKLTKPWPKEMDEWSHFHHNAAGTMVGGDTIVGPPRRLQWIGDPKWLRNHDFMSSMHAMVSSGGRVFYIIDEGLRNHIFLPSDWKLIARDAFNGTILWKRPLKDWQPQNWPLKSGPGDLPRRIVATPDTVYATAGLIEPLTALDARTGEILRTYEDTNATVEIIHSDGTLFVLTDPEKKPVRFRGESTKYSEIKRANSGWAWTTDSPQRVIKAIDAASGKIRWQHKSKVAPLTLTITTSQVFFHDGNSLISLDSSSGKVQWRSEPSAVKSVPTGGTLRVAYSDGVTVFAQGTKMTAYHAKSGQTLWSEKLQKTSHHCPEDLFIINGQIWSPNTGKPQEHGTHFVVFDLKTGNVNKDFVAKNIKGFPMHPRRYPSRATERFIMTNGMGTEFYEIGGTSVDVNNMVRGSCVYGVMPANGLLYKPPDSCACYYQSKLEYFCALAPQSSASKAVSTMVDRLQQGPAYGEIDRTNTKITNRDWPMYRRDESRSGYSPTSVPPDLRQVWSSQVGGKLTQPVVAGGLLVVSSVDQHTIHAIDSVSGKIRWRFTAGGRVDSSPTLYRGSVLFGCADGWVYCLRASDGALAWRYLAAPQDQQHVAFQQLESVWPVHGSLLVHNDVLYCLAGRNMFFDGGLRLALLDPDTGREQAVKLLDEQDPASGKNLQTLIKKKYMPVANADLLSCNGKNIFMQTQKFDLQGNRLNLAPILPGNETPDMVDDNHLFCQTGFLDTSWFHRSYWIYGNNCGEGWGDYAKTRSKSPAGRIMVVGDKKTYSFRANPLGNMLHPRQSYSIFAEDKDVASQTAVKNRKRRNDTRVKWQIDYPQLLVTGMAGGGKSLLLAGPPDLADESKMFGFLPGANDEHNQKLAQQEDAWQGKHGGIMWAVSTSDGTKLAEYKLDAFPVFDGMIAANGQLFMSMLDGTVRCYR